FVHIALRVLLPLGILAGGNRFCLSGHFLHGRILRSGNVRALESKGKRGKRAEFKERSPVGTHCLNDSKPRGARRSRYANLERAEELTGCVSRPPAAKDGCVSVLPKETVDRDHFAVYWRNGRDLIPVIVPPPAK